MTQDGCELIRELRRFFADGGGADVRCALPLGAQHATISSITSTWKK
jgi:hypothetical protein